MLIFCGCDTVKMDSKKAAKIHYRNPKVLAKFCSETYKPTDSVQVVKEYLQGEDVVFIDTVFEEVHSSDTAYIIKYITKTINKTDTIRDTKYVQVVNNAGLALCQKEKEEQADELARTETRLSIATWAAGIMGSILLFLLIWTILKRKAKTATDFLGI